MPNIVNITTFFNPLDLVAPHSCRGCGTLGSILCNRCKNNIISTHSFICPNCKAINKASDCPHCQDLPPIHTLGERSGVLDILIRNLKFESVRTAAIPLADAVHHILPEYDTPVAIVPLPTISKHIRTRGLDHTRLIAKHLIKFRPNFHLTKALTRAKDTIQVGSSRESRLSQASSAYKINPNFTFDPHTTYILLDDVWTTGASVRAAIEKLQQAGASQIEVIVLTISRLN